MPERTEPVTAPDVPTVPEAPVNSAAPAPPTAARLKSGVRARSLADEGVAVSMGATAVVVRGARADTVWRALEPALRAGFTRESLVATFPAPGRPFLEGVLDQLEDHGFLRELEDEHELSASERVAYPHLESLTARPFAALRALADSTVRVRSECPLLEAEVRRALGRAGFREVHADTGPGAGVLLTARIGVPGRGESPYLVAAGDGVWLSGPRDAPGDAALVERVREWFGGSAPDGTGTGSGSGAGLAITRALVAAQLALALVAHVARAVDEPVDPGPGPAADDGTSSDPEFMVTTDELVSEPHPFVALPPLGEGRPGGPMSAPWPAPPPPGPVPPSSLPERLDRVTHLWDRVFGPVGEPAPGDLPQLPVGLARVARSDVHGCGFTTAEARLDALLTALGSVAWPGVPARGTSPGTGGDTRSEVRGSASRGDGGRARGDVSGDGARAVGRRPGAEPSGTGWTAPVGRGLGLTLPAAIGASVGDLVLGTDTGWKDIGPPEPMSAPARRLWAALTLRFGVSASTRFRELDGTGLLRVDVVGADGAPLGTGVSADADGATREALLRAVANAALADGAVAVAATRTPQVVAALTRWAATSGRVRVGEPERAPEWAARGVYAAVASWT